MVVNKYARMVVMMMDVFLGFLYVNAMNKSVFVFSDFKMAEFIWMIRECIMLYAYSYNQLDQLKSSNYA